MHLNKGCRFENRSNIINDPDKVRTISALMAVLIVAVMIEPLYQIILSIIYFDTNAEILMLKPSLFGNIVGLIGNVSVNVITMLPWVLLILLTAALLFRPARKTLFRWVKWTSLGGIIITAGALLTTYLTKICHSFIVSEKDALFIDWYGLLLYVLMLTAGAAAIITFYFIAGNIEKSLPKGGLSIEQ